MRLVIGGPTLAMVPAAFAVDLAALYGNLLSTRWPWTSVTLGFIQSTYVHVGREAVLDRAIREQATHLLWLDTDMTFPENTARRLMQHDRPIVACNCVMKDPRILFTAQREGRGLLTGPDSTGLEEADSVGTAVLLMRTDVVAGLERPWFRHGTNPDTGRDVGEDVMFCRALRAAGHTIWIDHDLSKEIGHIGQYTYRPREAPLAV